MLSERKNIPMKLWLNRLSCEVPAGIQSPAELARFELENAVPGGSFEFLEQADMGDSFRIEPLNGGAFRLAGGKTGLLYGAYRLITDRLCGADMVSPVFSAPKYALRMIDCWDNADGSVERGYAGRSLFFDGGRLSYDPERIRTLGRLLASAGLNVLCINNVNVHFPARLLLEDYLQDLAALAEQFRPFGVRLMLSVDFSQPMRHGIPSADPLDPADDLLHLVGLQVTDEMHARAVVGVL